MLTLTTVDRISLPTASDFCELETGLEFTFKFFTDVSSHHWLWYHPCLLFYLNPIRTSLISLLVSVGIAFRRAYRPIEDPRGIENENWNLSVNKKKQDLNPLPECRQILAAGTGSSSTGKPQCCAATDYPRAGWKKKLYQNTNKDDLVSSSLMISLTSLHLLKVEASGGKEAPASLLLSLNGVGAGKGAANNLDYLSLSFWFHLLSTSISAVFIRNIVDWMAIPIWWSDVLLWKSMFSTISSLLYTFNSPP